MGQVAHIRYDGGALLLPAHDPYDREVVFQEAEFCAKRHGSAGLELGRTRMRVSIADDASAVCAHCHLRLGALTFLIDRLELCGHCARRGLRSRSASHR
jgi:hypothetical protein